MPICAMKFLNYDRNKVHESRSGVYANLWSNLKSNPLKFIASICTNEGTELKNFGNIVCFYVCRSWRNNVIRLYINGLDHGLYFFGKDINVLGALLLRLCLKTCLRILN
ncbi:hypothetical protein KIL84_003779 [Mauremys mutica]|uniref:Uncharacterized protein n=1 Tax=Mauremys mutica TaxID=74926 RepID=A0A9D3WW99_9SAUR|nr:hypothetical protein KIL84_003779 [Mauremys mutica]